MMNIVLWLVKLIPVAYRFPAAAAGVVAVLLLGGWGGWTLHGWLGAGDQVAALKTQIEVERQAAQLTLAVARAAEKITVRYVDRIKVVRQKGDTIIQKVPVYVQADNDCKSLPAGFGVLHDAAAGSALPDDRAAGDSDAPAARIDLSRAAGVVAENYTRCQENAVQLIDLQDWIRQTLTTTKE